MADPAARDLPRIAFVFGDASLAEHVREAVTGHAEITYSVPAQEFDAARLVDAQVASALVNVDGGDWLDEIESRLDAAGVPVVFNDPDYSRGLDGWDRARWLRHLTAKLCGSEDFDPPRPAAGAADPAAVAADVAPATAEAAPGDALDLPAATGLPEATEDVAPSEPASSSGDAVAERPLSPHEIETMTADFVAAPGQYTESASAWQPTAVTVHVSAQPFVSASLAETTLQPEPLVSEPQVFEQAVPEPATAEPDAAVPAEAMQPASDAPSPPEPDAAPDMMDVDTEALLAQIDERLAQPESSMGMRDAWNAPGAAPGDTDAHVAAPVDDPALSAYAAVGMDTLPAADVAAVPANDPDADILASLPSLDDWQLLDADAIPEIAKSGSVPVAPELPDSLSNLTLVPMDPMGLAMPINTDPIERWIDEAEGRTKPKDDGDKA